jgi:hypothetical protein
MSLSGTRIFASHKRRVLPGAIKDFTFGENKKAAKRLPFAYRV